MPTDPADLGYLAGIIDGEGFIGTLKRHSPERPCWAVGVTNTDAGLMEWLKTIGGGVTTLQATERHKEKYNWWLRSRADVYLFLSPIEPHLRIKRAKAQAALSDLHLFLAKYLGLSLSREEVEADLDRYLALERDAVLGPRLIDQGAGR